MTDKPASRGTSFSVAHVIRAAHHGDAPAVPTEDGFRGTPFTAADLAKVRTYKKFVKAVRKVRKVK